MIFLFVIFFSFTVTMLIAAFSQPKIFRYIKALRRSKLVRSILFESHSQHQSTMLKRTTSGVCDVGVKTERSPKLTSEISKFKQVKIDWLPKSTFTFHRAVDSNIELLPRTDDVNTPLTDDVAPGRRLVVIFAWLFAKERHLDKYRTLYMERGFDILTVKEQVKDFLIPGSGSHPIARKVVRFIGERAPQYDSLIFHAFSVGAYQLGEVLVALGKERSKQYEAAVLPIFRGMIYDSALDINEAPIGLGKASTNNTVLQWAIATMMNAHLKLCYYVSTQHYIKSSKAVHENCYGTPALLFISKDDEVANYENQFDIIAKWRAKGVPVRYKCWDQSPHVSHFFKHPNDYREMMDDFLHNIAKIL